MSDLVTTYDIDDQGVALIRLDRPNARNAINSQMLDELLGHLAAAREAGARVLVISSTDHLSLSAGADLREELDAGGQVERIAKFARLYEEVVEFPGVTICACHGACVGGGAEIAVACDLRVGGSNLRMRFPGAALGIPVGPARLVTLCGLSVAKYLLLTSKEIAVDDAHRWGLVHKVAPAPATEEAALQLAAQVAEHDPGSVGQIKRMLHDFDGIEERTRAEGVAQTEHVKARGGLQ